MFPKQVISQSRWISLIPRTRLIFWYGSRIKTNRKSTRGSNCLNPDVRKKPLPRKRLSVGYGLSWRDHSSATVTCIIGADGVCNYTWKVKGSDKDGGSGSINIKADKSFNIELNNLPDKEIEVYLTAKDSKGKDIDLQPTINGVVKTAKSFKITLSQSSRPKQLRHHLRLMYREQIFRL